MKFVFFGTPTLATIVLDQLEAAHLTPSLVVTAPDKPAGRGMQLKASPVKEWARARDIPVLEPETFTDAIRERIAAEDAQVYVLVAYGKILPQSVIDLAPQGIVNVHPSLLPKLRGPSPVRTAILEDHKTVGVSLMLIDDKMDHGPILMQEAYTPDIWPPDARELDTHLFTRGGELLGTVLPQYIAGDLVPVAQDDSIATYCKLFTKQDGLLDLADDPYTNLLKIHAYAGWPGTYFFAENGARVKIVSVHMSENNLVIDEVVPESKSKMSYEHFTSKNAMHS